jgi:hypothetical protein
MPNKCNVCEKRITKEESKEYFGSCYNCYFGVSKDCTEVEDYE